MRTLPPSADRPASPALPVANAQARPFIEGLAAGALRFQHCAACDTAQTLARHACQHCGERAALTWREASGRATVQAVTEVSRAPSDAFRPLLPYTLVIVSLDEGPRLMGHGSPGLAIGERVVASFFDHAGHRLIRFLRDD